MDITVTASNSKEYCCEEANVNVHFPIRPVNTRYINEPSYLRNSASAKSSSTRLVLRFFFGMRLL